MNLAAEKPSWGATETLTAPLELVQYLLKKKKKKNPWQETKINKTHLKIENYIKKLNK